MDDPYMQKSSQRLTKKFFFGLPAGAWLISNCFDPKSNHSKFCEPVASATERTNQWFRIKAAQIDQRACHVFACKDDCEKWISHVNQIISGQI